MAASLDDKLDAIARHPFRARFHLRGRDLATAQLRGPSTGRLRGGRDLPLDRARSGGSGRAAGPELGSGGLTPPTGAW